MTGVDTMPIQTYVTDELKVREQYPGLIETGANDPAKFRYFHPEWAKRTTHRDLGAPTRNY